MLQENESKLVNAIAEMEEQEALALTDQFIAAGMPPQKLLDLAQAAMAMIGSRFEKGEYYLPHLMLAGEMISQIAEKVKPLLAAQGGQRPQADKPTVLIGTVEGDLHDIGKNIVTFMLDVNGYNVIDLGINVPIQTFVDEVRKHDPKVLGLSGFLTLAFDSMRNTIKAIEAAGLRQGRKIMIGGGQVDETVCKYTTADAYGRTAVDAVRLCQGWLGKQS